MRLLIKLFAASIITSTIISTAALAQYVDIAAIGVRMKSFNLKPFDSPTYNIKEWKVVQTFDDPGVPSTAGFVIHVEKNISLQGESLEPISWIYDANTTFQAVYMITNAHVWNDDGEASVQRNFLREGRSDLWMLRQISFYRDNFPSDVQKVTSLYAFNSERVAVNRWFNKDYVFDLENLGIKKLGSCMNLKGSWESRGVKSSSLGCDFVLIRFLLPNSLDIKPYNPQKQRAREVAVRFAPHQIAYHRVLSYGNVINNIEIFLTKANTSRFYSVVPGWSGSPVFDKNTGGVVGLASVKPSSTTRHLISYSISSIFDNLKVEDKIISDIETLKSQAIKAPFRVNIWGPTDASVWGLDK